MNKETRIQRTVQIGNRSGRAAQGAERERRYCRERDITDSLYYKWRDEFMERAPAIFADKRHKAIDETAERMAELERLVGRLTMELEIAKKASVLLGSRWKANGRGDDCPVEG